MLGLVVGAAAVALLVVCGAAAGIFVATTDDDGDPGAPLAATSSPSSGVDVRVPASPSQGVDAPQDDDAPLDNNAVTARYSSDFEAVCEGSPILNAKDYTDGSAAKVFTFYNPVDRPSSWLLRSVGYGKPYYTKTTEFRQVNVVGCLAYVAGSEGPGRSCRLKDSSGTIVTVEYVSSRYKLTFYSARTAQQVGDGGTINAPAGRCPSFVTYDKNTMKAYASPDAGAIEAALEKFLS